MPKPFGAFSPGTQSTAIIFPSRPILAIEPFPSLPQGSFPSILEAYSTLFSASNKTDSGTFSMVSVSQSLVTECCANAGTQTANSAAVKKIDFMKESFE